MLEILASREAANREKARAVRDAADKDWSQAKQRFGDGLFVSPEEHRSPARSQRFNEEAAHDDRDAEA